MIKKLLATAGLFCIYSHAALAADWQAAYDDAQSKLRDGQAVAAIAAFEDALATDPTGRQRAETLYLMAAAYFQKQDMSEALVRLKEVVALYDSGAFDDSNLLRNALRRGAQLAYQLRDEETAQAYAERGRAMDAVSPEIWDIDAADTRRHKRTGITYPVALAGFERVSLTVFRPDGTDVGAEYVFPLEDGVVRIVAYSTENYPLKAEQNLHSSIQTMKAEMAQPQEVESGVFAPTGEEGPKGAYALYRATGGAAPIVSGYYVAARGTTHYKLHVRYPASGGDAAQAAVDAFISAFDWP